MSGLRLIVLILVALFGLAIGALFTLPVPHPEFASVRVRDASLVAEVAADPAARSRGLSERDGLARNQAMLFVFDKPGRYGVRISGMRFPIDVLWIKDGVVADIEETARSSPDSRNSAAVYHPDVFAEMILETGAGFAARHEVRIGDRVYIDIDREEKPFSAIARGLQQAVNSAEPGPSRAGEEYFIESLRAVPRSGKDFKIVRLLQTKSAYHKFLISYRSDGLTISGVMNIPRQAQPKDGFPALILNHGLIHPSVYFSGRGSKREQDFFAKNGYITIHPDYRGLATSDPDPAKHHDFYVGYTRDVVALIEALKELKPTMMDLNRIGMWGHSMGGGIAARAMVLSPDIRAYVLFAPISADAEDNFYELTRAETEWLRKTYGSKDAEVYRKISPLEYFQYVETPVQLHHGENDKDVPILFSEKMYSTLTRLGKKAEFYRYPGEKHEFADAWTLAANRALQFFDRYVKSAR